MVSVVSVTMTTGEKIIEHRAMSVVRVDTLVSSLRVRVNATANAVMSVVMVVDRNIYPQSMNGLGPSQLIVSFLFPARVQN